MLNYSVCFSPLQNKCKSVSSTLNILQGPQYLYKMCLSQNYNLYIVFDNQSDKSSHILKLTVDYEYEWSYHYF